MMNPGVEKGKFLFADPFLHDPHFKRSVILLVEHNEQGTVGFIMNKRMEIKLDNILPEPLHLDTEVYYGGPVSTNSLYYMHRMGHLISDSVEIGNGYFWGGDFETIRSLVNTSILKKDDIRFFVGYSGWGNGQLLGEVGEKSWVVDDFDLPTAFSEEQALDLWRQKMTTLGNNYALWANFPENPSLN